MGAYLNACVGWFASTMASRLGAMAIRHGKLAMLPPILPTLLQSLDLLLVYHGIGADPGARIWTDCILIFV